MYCAIRGPAPPAGGGGAATQNGAPVYLHFGLFRARVAWAVSRGRATRAGLGTPAGVPATGSAGRTGCAGTIRARAAGGSLTLAPVAGRIGDLLRNGACRASGTARAQRGHSWAAKAEGEPAGPFRGQYIHIASQCTGGRGVVGALRQNGPPIY